MLDGTTEAERKSERKLTQVGPAGATRPIVKLNAVLRITRYWTKWLRTNASSLLVIAKSEILISKLPTNPNAEV